ncbi:alpha/beta hydrolase [Dictyobacter aurantiacus]|uniref:Lipase n=1 Tax=Dictyobacter aurantiacus TaxID=1936993 RepID=A0A401ZSK2_9CHLR|nr:alpha/beta hydrolase [Dictyobacter aurantiacus]GCE09843.1 lipase [Dictyobacter aurantiacus]
MQLSLPGCPYACNLLPALQYGEVPDVPPWEAPLCLDLLLPSPMPAQPVPAVIYAHGGGWAEGERSSGLYPWLNPLLTAHGFVTVSITYRLSRFAPFPAQIYDAKAAVRWLRSQAQKYHIDPERIGVWGDSAGGHLGALLGMTGDWPELEGSCGSPGFSSRVQAVVARCAPYDFLHPGGELINDAPSPVTQLFDGTITEREDLMRQASPFYYVGPDVPPFQIVHGTLDETVPFEQAERFTQALNEAGNKVDFHPLEGAYHNLRQQQLLPWSDTPWEELGARALSFFQKHLDY